VPRLLAVPRILAVPTIIRSIRSTGLSKKKKKKKEIVWRPRERIGGVLLYPRHSGHDNRAHHQNEGDDMTATTTPAADNRVNVE
jgi:hypothetical protein